MKALILVDIQYDFIPGGALAVTDGDKVVSVANEWMPKFEHVIATQDWHPAGHQSFASEHAGKNPGDLVDLHGLPQILWPDHCVQGSHGAEFVEELEFPPNLEVFQKGTNPEIDSYSGFWDNGRRANTGLGDYLKKLGITQVWVMGLATDYCVKFTVLDAVSEGFETFVIRDGCRGVNLSAGDDQKAFEEMERAGATLV
ncbi:bifunctional nicotinamidase/pyrazinamidase [Microvenator marinus]|jgi:nicotinamidase/pyrazinamidase|uniref:Nicotinamidase n=1 Tax=Microvenator marinus TaxID=2600177 RepID=A0A5B8XRH4_9DELT|nr:bifunctional nicotinamidase/pyrazinamidase [Microvenator marinus]QED27548.1 bifunctional nicotinamidase/pyrazinamidase [Microvenator marinus]